MLGLNPVPLVTPALLPPWNVGVVGIWLLLYTAPAIPASTTPVPISPVPTTPWAASAGAQIVLEASSAPTLLIHVRLYQNDTKTHW